MNRISILICSTLLLSIFIVACQSKTKKGAEQMIDTADSLVNMDELDSALQWLDSVKVVYPNEVESRRIALEKSREIKLELSRRDSLVSVERLNRLETFTDSLYQQFRLIPANDLPDESILRYKGYDPASKAPHLPFIDAYIANDGTLELIASASSTNQLNIAFIRISEQANDTYVLSDTLQYDGGLNYRYTDLGRHYERLTFAGKRGMPLGEFVALAPDSSRLSVAFLNGRGKAVVHFDLNKEAREAITNSYKYVAALEEMKEIYSRLNKHEKRLQNSLDLNSAEKIR
ncbi:hypothetical protein [uncultured Porphyromonas sp.]|uniref:hypothetical protein n=1 Tax=uncultured Porphyromonas sp. TaxID=159274 RepID=UPI00262E2873|nr:hypothetical protein [uncultured Porphyromonas sp.]